eukprot:scaffold266382_cov30-Tisochrysis_lutea.AAC.6
MPLRWRGRSLRCQSHRWPSQVPTPAMSYARVGAVAGGGPICMHDARRGWGRGRIVGGFGW